MSCIGRSATICNTCSNTVAVSVVSALSQCSCCNCCSICSVCSSRDRAEGGAGGALGLEGRDILAKIKQFSEAEKCIMSEIITICKLFLVNSATSAAGERSFSSTLRLKTWLRSAMTQTRFSSPGNLTILNTHRRRTDKLCLIDVANELAALNDNRKSSFGTFKESDLKMSG